MKKSRKTKFLITAVLTLVIFLILPLTVLVVKKQLDDRSKATHNPTVSTPWIISDPYQCPGGACVDDFFAMSLQPLSDTPLIGGQSFRMRFEFSRTTRNPYTPPSHSVTFRFYSTGSNGNYISEVFTYAEVLSTDFEPWATQAVITSPVQLAPGTYAVTASVDSSQQISEISENNNSIVQEITVNTDAFHTVKPVAAISFPTENQLVLQDVDRSLCLNTSVSDIPNLMRRAKINSAEWTEYEYIPSAAPMKPICFDPASGSNSVQLQYKSPSGEGDILTRSFTTQWICSAQPHYDYDQNSYAGVLDYSIFLKHWRASGPRGDYDCSGNVQLRDFIQFLNDLRAGFRGQ